jgi:multidrug efflux pump subunit AcrB
VPFSHRQDLVGLFAQHKVASNLLMVMMLIGGFWGLSKLNTQFFPNFALDIVSVRVVWTGASAEDVERSITEPLEQELRNLDNLKKMTSTSAIGVSSITLEYDEGTEMGTALDQVKERVGLVRELPATAEEPEITSLVRYEPIGRLLVTGPAELRELRPFVRAAERELLDRGIAKIEITGLPQEEFAIQVPSAALHELGLSLDQIAEQVRRNSRDLPAGTVGRNDVSRQLRSLGQRRREVGFEDLPLVADESGRLVRLGDVATIERRPRAREVEVTYLGKPAVELRLMRAERGDSLKSARILAEWMAEVREKLPPGIELHVFDQGWQLIKDRIFLLVKNGAGGLLLVLGILFLFLNGRVAFWVAVGIPVSFMATIAVLYAVGGSINMISLFAMIMALGIIVDDAIVVGEDALTHYQSGEASLEAAEGGARRMLAPVVSSSLTTISAFLPLMLVGGIIGNILFDIPLVVICVLLASLVECFLVLPGHLRHAFRKLHHRPPKPLRQRLDHAFFALRDGHFRRLVTLAVDNRFTTLSLAIALLVVSVGLVKGGRVNFTFFPSVESNIVFANATFVSGTPPARVSAFIQEVEQALWEAEKELGGNLVVMAVPRNGESLSSGAQGQTGEQFGSLLVELVASDIRDVRNEELIRVWEQKVRLPPGIENFTLVSRRAGPPGREIDVELTGPGAHVLKPAAQELAEVLRTIQGVSAIEDDMPYGQEQLIYRLTPAGEALGLSIESVGRQLRAAFDGHLAQVFYDGVEELEVRVVLPDEERHNLARLDQLNIVLPSGETAPLRTVLELTSRRGFDILRHTQGRLAVHVLADVDRRVANENRVRDQLESEVFPRLAERYDVRATLEGRASDQSETLADMKRGLVIALALIYLILAWVFGSYGWPLVVMAAIPFGIVGALMGHFVMGIDLTILSMFGLFGLSGIVVNDSIILVTFYKHLREAGKGTREAIIEAACQRLRAVLLTSLTTIAGLMPLLFETSLQAQFLIPMAVSISFGLGFATVLVLIVIPSLLSVHESVAERLRPAQSRPDVQIG